MATDNFADFDLLIMPSEGRYLARVNESPVGQAKTLFDLPFTVSELARFTWLSGRVTRQLRPTGDTQEPPLGVQAFGSRLFEAVFGGEVGECLVRSLDKTDEPGRGLRINLHLNDVPELADLPWEYLYASGPHEGFLALSDSTPIVRYLEMAKGSTILSVRPPLGILVVVSDPQDVPKLDVEREWRLLHDAVDPLQSSGAIRLERLEPPTLAALQRRLRKPGDMHILHFIGHGKYDSAVEAGGLYFEKADRSHHFVAAGDLALLLKDYAPLRLAYLNACEGARGGEQNLFAGTAQTLVRQGIPAVLAMQFPVSDEAALALAHEFYQALADGLPVDAAVGEARKAVKTAGNEMEWGTPVLFSRSADNRLLEIVEPLPLCPYPGMRPFKTTEASAFYGRDVEIADGVDRLRRHPFLTVIGPSGSGKSSLVYAGMIPALLKSTLFGPGEWAVKSMRPGTMPLSELGKQIDLDIPVPVGHRLLLVIDQFEETFALAQKGESEAFLAKLQQLMTVDDLYLILTVRADFYPELMISSLWPKMKNRRLEVTPLDESQLREVIVRPAEAVGVRVDAALVERLVADAANEPGVLPLIQETLVLLWDSAKTRSLSLQIYEEMYRANNGIDRDGRTGLQIAISRHAEDVYNNFSNHAQIIVRRVFLNLIQLGEGRADTRRQRKVKDLYASSDDPTIFEDTLSVLTKNRLVTLSSDYKNHDRLVDISHEALIGGWTRLKEWLNLDREWLQLQDEVRRLTVTWDSASRDDALLPRWNPRLAMIHELSKQPENAGKLTSDQEAFLAAVVQLRDREALQEKRRKSVQRRRLIALVSSIILAIGLVVVSVLVTNEERRARSELRSKSLADDAMNGLAFDPNALAFDPEVSVLLASHALQEERYTYEAERALRTALQQSRIVERIEHNVPNARLSVLSKDGRWLAVGDQSGKIYVTATVGDDPIHAELDLGMGSQIHAAEFSPSGQLLGAVDDTYGLVKVWRLPTMEEALYLQFDSQTTTITGIAMHPNDLEIALQVQSYGEISEIQVWDLVSKTRMNFTEVSKAYSSLSYSDDGGLLAVTSLPNRVSIWDNRLIAELANLPVIGTTNSEEEIRTLAFGPDNQFAIGTTRGSIALWNFENLDEPTLKYSRKGHPSAISDVAFSHNGKCLASVGRDFQVNIWNAEGELQHGLLGHSDEIDSVAFMDVQPSVDSLSECGERAVTVSPRDGTARIWNIGPSVEYRTAILSNSPIESVDFSPKGEYLVVGGDDGVARVLMSDTLSQIAMLKHEARVNHVEFDESGEKFVTASYDKKAAISMVDDSDHPIWIDPGGGRVFSASFRPTSNLEVVTGDEQGQVILWDALTGQQLGLLFKGINWINVVAFDSTGSRLALGQASVGVANVVEIDSMRVFTLALEAGTSVYSVAFGSDDEVYTLASNGKVRKWSLVQGQNTYQIEESRPIETHSGGATTIALDPHQRRLATSGRDGRISLQNAQSSQRLSLLNGNGSIINDVAFSVSPYGETLVTVDERGELRYYLVNATELATFAKDVRTTRVLTNTECQQYEIDINCNGGS